MKFRPLTLKENLFLLQLLALIPWILGSIFILWHYYPEIKHLRDRLEAKEKIPPLFETISLLQKHRGLCYLKSFTQEAKELHQIKATLQEIENQIDSSFNKTLSLYSSEERTLLLKYHKDWQKLKRDHLHISPLESFFQHTGIIVSLLQFLKTEGEKHQLFAEPDLYLRTLAQVSLLELPNLIEALGKLRAIGSAGVERNHMPPEDKKIFLQNFQALQGYQEVLRWTLLNIKFPRKIIIALESSFKLLNDFMNLSQTFLINDFRGGFALTGYGYYKLATAVIDSFYSLQSLILSEYLQQIEEKKKELIRSGLLSFLFLSLVLGGISLFFYLSYQRLARRLSQIAKETQKIASGDLSARITLDYEDEIGKVIKLLNASLDELERRLREIYFLHYYDPLTGAPNRESLLSELKKRKVINLLLLDIDNFKALNTLYGEEIGDQVLKHISQRLKEAFETEVYRVGPDEFALILPEEDLKTLFPRVETLLQEVEREPLRYQDLEVFFHLRGAMIYECVHPEHTLSHAYSLLKEVVKKAKVIDCVVSPSINRSSLYKETILYVRKIRSAIEERRYQPVFDNKTKEIVKVEALMRIQEKDGEILPPSKFLPIAKESGYYPLLTLKIFEEVKKHLPLIPWDVSINLSFSDLLNKEILQSFLSLIEDCSKKLMLKHKIVLELLETEEIELYERLTPVVLEIKKEGVRLAIDDFGAGYSNLQRLIELEVDFIKIDASIVKRLPESEKARNLVRAVGRFARAAGIRTIAEFVADERIFNLVCELGVDYSQGYYFSPPLSLEDLLKLRPQV